ncbi:MAG: hypothetical protein RI884_3099 [Pseudomonadota bacterium]|jgi:hypothetical protein
MIASAPRPLQPVRRYLLVLAMLALVLAQAVGGWHRIGHGMAHATHADRGAAQVCDSEQDGSQASDANAFEHDAGSQTCKLLDALTHADGASEAPALGFLPLAREHAAQRTYRVVAVADVPAAARGPPAIH